VQRVNSRLRTENAVLDSYKQRRLTVRRVARAGAGGRARARRRRALNVVSA